MHRKGRRKKDLEKHQREKPRRKWLMKMNPKVNVRPKEKGEFFRHKGMHLPGTRRGEERTDTTTGKKDAQATCTEGENLTPPAG